MAENKMVIEEALSVNFGKRFVIVPGVDDIRADLQSFRWPDYVVCIFWLVICLMIGVYFGFFSVANNAQEYLLGGRKFKTLPVAMSLAISFIGGIQILTIPTEVYLYGIQRIYLVVGHLAMAVIMTFIYIPVFSNLKLTSVYEYLERRFNKEARILGSLLFIVSTIAFLPIVIYVPVSAFNEVTFLDSRFMTPIICMIGIFYTSLGGIKAIVWTDVVQITIIFAALILVSIKGTFDIGDISSVIDPNLRTGRIEGPNLDVNSTAKYNFWSTTIGGCFYYLHISGVNQNILQKYFCLQSVTSTKRATWLFTTVFCLMFILCTFCGLQIYAMFYECDPLTTKLSREHNQLLPLFVIKTLGNFPGLLGLFVVAIWSASLSFWSTSLNALTTVVFEDFYSFISTRQFSEKRHTDLMKLTAIILGTICVALISTIANVDTVIRISQLIQCISSGASLGMFTSGVIFPWINGKGVVVGGLSSLIVMTWLTTEKSINSNAALSEKVLTTTGCRYHYYPQKGHQNVTTFINSGEDFSVYGFSYLWYTLAGTLITIIVGLIVSLIFEPSDPRDVDPKLLAPFLKKIIKPRDFPNEPGEGIIYAFDTHRKVTVNGPLANIVELK